MLTIRLGLYYTVACEGVLRLGLGIGTCVC
jgi:hypothetical protein